MKGVDSATVCRESHVTKVTRGDVEGTTPADLVRSRRRKVVGLYGRTTLSVCVRCGAAAEPCPWG